MLVVESTLRIFVQFRDIDDDLSFCIKFHVRAVHWPWRRPFEIDSFTIVATAMTTALELVLTRLPFGRASQMTAARVIHKQTIGGSGYPNSILLLPLRVNSKRIIRRHPDSKHARWFKDRARQEEAQEHQEVDKQKTADRRPDDPASHLIDFGIWCAFN